MIAITILVVDDEPDLVDLFERRFRREIRRHDYVMHYADSGEAALALLSEGTDPEVMLILSDINMPGMSGRELCEAVRRELYHQPSIFVVTGRPGKQHREWPKDLANVEFVEKPVSLRKLIAQIDECLKKREAEGA